MCPDPTRFPPTLYLHESILFRGDGRTADRMGLRRGNSGGLYWVNQLGGTTAIKLNNFHLQLRSTDSGSQSFEKSFHERKKLVAGVR